MRQAQKRRLRVEAPDDSAAPKTITLQELELLIKQNKKQFGAGAGGGQAHVSAASSMVQFLRAPVLSCGSSLSR